MSHVFMPFFFSNVIYFVTDLQNSFDLISIDTDIPCRTYWKKYLVECRYHESISVPYKYFNATLEFIFHSVDHSLFLSYFILMLIYKISHFVKAISKISTWFSFMFKHVLYGLLKHFTFEFGLWTRYFSTLFVVVNQKPSVNIANTLWRISPERKKNSRLILDDSLISKDNNGD